MLVDPVQVQAPEEFYQTEAVRGGWRVRLFAQPLALLVYGRTTIVQLLAGRYLPDDALYAFKL